MTFLLGFLTCYLVITGLSVRKALLFAEQVTSMSSEGASATEAEFHKDACDLFYRGNLKKLAEKLKINIGDVSMKANGAAFYRQPSTPVAEIVIYNISQRPIVIYEPYLLKLSSASFNAGGIIKDEFSLNFQFNPERICHYLRPGENISFPLLFPVKGDGAHVINLSAVFPLDADRQGGQVTWSYCTASRLQYMFTLMGSTNSQP
jgi:hypothetical protein